MYTFLSLTYDQLGENSPTDIDSKLSNKLLTLFLNAAAGTT